MSSSDNKNIDSNDPVDEVIDLETLAAQAQNLTLDKDELHSLSDNLKIFFDCEVISLFAYDNSKRELYTRSLESPLAEEIRLEISLKNVAGFVAATGNAVNIKNVRSRNELSKYDRELVYDSSWDEKLKFNTHTMIAVPLPHRNQLVGVMELINKLDGKTFTDEDFTQAKAIAPMMGYALARLDEQEQSHNKKSSTEYPFNIREIKFTIKIRTIEDRI